MDSEKSPQTQGCQLAFQRPDEQTLEVRLCGEWLLSSERPPVKDVERELAGQPVKKLRILAEDVGAWDSALLTFVRHLQKAGEKASVEVDAGGLPEGAKRLLALSESVPEAQGAQKKKEAPHWIARVGELAIARAKGGVEFLDFLGKLTVALGRFVSFRARYQARDLWLLIQQCGAQALPIVALIAFLVGLILAFVGAVQLRQFGAQIYVADLVGLGMAREMGALMTAIIMSGRTGAAFAAQLGTMKVNEEVDALVTLGIPPIEYLVLPRMLALCLMMPLLCVFADVIGIAGGGFVGTLMLDIPLNAYVERTIQAISMTDYVLGVVKSGVFGVLVAISGCLRGMQCTGSASAVGAATTSSVVTSIVAIVCADGVFAVLTNLLEI